MFSTTTTLHFGFHSKLDFKLNEKKTVQTPEEKADAKSHGLQLMAQAATRKVVQKSQWVERGGDFRVVLQGPFTPHAPKG